MRITTKGQVTIPVEIREKLGLLPNTEVEFEVVGQAVRMRKVRPAQGAAGRRGKSIVHVGSKQSEPFDRTGRLGFSRDGKTLEFVGLKANKLYHVKMKL